jgi:hypothetical protein
LGLDHADLLGPSFDACLGGEAGDIRFEDRDFGPETGLLPLGGLHVEALAGDEAVLEDGEHRREEKEGEGGDERPVDAGAGERNPERAADATDWVVDGGHG